MVAFAGPITVLVHKLRWTSQTLANQLAMEAGQEFAAWGLARPVGLAGPSPAAAAAQGRRGGAGGGGGGVVEAMPGLLGLDVAAWDAELRDAFVGLLADGLPK